MGHKESLGMGLCLHFWRLFISMYSLWMWRMSRNDKNVYPYLLSFKLGTQTILEMYYLLQWHTDHLNCLLGSVSPYTLHSQSTFKTKVPLYTSLLSYKHCKLKWEKSVNTRINHFSNSFPVYRLPAQTNVDTDAPLRYIASVPKWLQKQSQGIQFLKISWGSMPPDPLALHTLMLRYAHMHLCNCPSKYSGFLVWERC